MNHNTDDMDQMIREAMSEEEAAFYDTLGEPSVPQMVTEVFQGRMRWLNRAAVLIGLAFMALGVWSVFKIIEVEETRRLVWWTATFFFSLGAIFAMKIWYWMELNRHALSREIKRLEMQIVSLRRHLESGS